MWCFSLLLFGSGALFIFLTLLRMNKMGVLLIELEQDHVTRISVVGRQSPVVLAQMKPNNAMAERVSCA